MSRGGRFAHWYVNFERDSTWGGPFFDVTDEKLGLVGAARHGYVDEHAVRKEMAAPGWDAP